MKVLAIFPYPTASLRRRVDEGAAPDTYLMGLNHLGPEIQVDFLDPTLTKTSDTMWKITRFSPMSERFFPANLLQQLRAIDRQRDYDALIIRDLKNVFLPALSRRLLRTRTFTLLLNVIVEGSGKMDFLLSPILRGIDILAYDAKAMSKTLVKGIGLEESRLWYLPFGVDTEFFSPGVVDSDNNIISVGDTNRDYGTLLRAMKMLGMKCRIFSSRVLPLPGGTGFDLSAVSTSLATVSFAEVDLLKSEYARAEIVVIPMNETRTASGVTSLLEAMAMGKAIIVAGTAGISDYVKDGRSAMTYRPGEHLDLARQIEYLLQDGELRERLGREARNYAVQSFSTAEEGRKIEKLLQCRVATALNT